MRNEVVVEYKIFSTNNTMSMEGWVRDALLDGWQPWGSLGVSKAQTPVSMAYNQAMVRYSTSGNDKKVVSEWVNKTP